MSGYSRMFLHFLHAMTRDGDRVHSFVFGTRLTNITRYLRTKDVDVALDKVSDVVTDWSGGTRIGSCLHDFNRDWSRRVLGQGAHVLLISDGLDREADGMLEAEMSRLHKSCRQTGLAQSLCCASTALKPGRPGSRRCCRMLTSSGRCTILRVLKHLWPRLHGQRIAPLIRAHG